MMEVKRVCCTYTLLDSYRKAREKKLLGLKCSFVGDVLAFH